MKKYENLNSEEKEKLFIAALDFIKTNEKRVDLAIQEATIKYPPQEERLFYPELWYAGNWYWFAGLCSNFVKEELKWN